MGTLEIMFDTLFVYEKTTDTVRARNEDAQEFLRKVKELEAENKSLLEHIKDLEAEKDKLKSQMDSAEWVLRRQEALLKRVRP